MLLLLTSTYTSVPLACLPASIHRHASINQPTNPDRRNGQSFAARRGARVGLGSEVDRRNATFANSTRGVGGRGKFAFRRRQAVLRVGARHVVEKGMKAR